MHCFTRVIEISPKDAAPLLKTEGLRHPVILLCKITKSGRESKAQRYALNNFQTAPDYKEPPRKPMKLHAE